MPFHQSIIGKEPLRPASYLSLVSQASANLISSHTKLVQPEHQHPSVYLRGLPVEDVEDLPLLHFLGQSSPEMRGQALQLGEDGPALLALQGATAHDDHRPLGRPEGLQIRLTAETAKMESQ